jgi:hypothetical protein
LSSESGWRVSLGAILLLVVSYLIYLLRYPLWWLFTYVEQVFVMLIVSYSVVLILALFLLKKDSKKLPLNVFKMTSRLMVLVGVIFALRARTFEPAKKTGGDSLNNNEEERRGGQPKTDRARFMEHYSLTEEQMDQILEWIGEDVYKLLPERGSGLAQDDSEREKLHEAAKRREEKYGIKFREGEGHLTPPEDYPQARARDSPEKEFCSWHQQS